MGDVKLISLSWMIAILNIFDGLATYYGLANKMMEEANPVMDLLWKTNPLFFLGAKVSLSLLIIYVSSGVFQKSGQAFRRLYGIVLAGVLCLYVGVLFLHMTWMAFL